MKKPIIYWACMLFLFITFLNFEYLGMFGILIGYFIGYFNGITNPPKFKTKTKSKSDLYSDNEDIDI